MCAPLIDGKGTSMNFLNETWSSIRKECHGNWSCHDHGVYCSHQRLLQAFFSVLSILQLVNPNPRTFWPPTEVFPSKKGKPQCHVTLALIIERGWAIISCPSHLKTNSLLSENYIMNTPRYIVILATNYDFSYSNYPYLTVISKRFSVKSHKQKKWEGSRPSVILSWKWNFGSSVEAQIYIALYSKL